MPRRSWHGPTVPQEPAEVTLAEMGRADSLEFGSCADLASILDQSVVVTVAPSQSPSQSPQNSTQSQDLVLASQSLGQSQGLGAAVAAGGSQNLRHSSSIGDSCAAMRAEVATARVKPATDHTRYRLRE
jgi:hypothetical protein